MTTLYVVSTERQVEIVSRDGGRAETRHGLFERLATAFVPNVRFARAMAVRSALSIVLARADDHLLGERPSASGSWEHVVDSIDDALAALRALGVDAHALGMVELEESFAHVLRTALNKLDARLSLAGLVDERLRRAHLAEALGRAEPADVARVVGASELRARFLVRWDADAGWWKALARSLRGASGNAFVELPIVAKPIDAARTSDPFESVVFGVARALDEAPVEFPIEGALGDLTFTTEVSTRARERVEVRRALDAEAQARAAVHAVTQALGGGVAIDRVAIATPRGISRDARKALKRHFEEAKIAIHFDGTPDAEGALASVAFSLLMLGADGLPRREVAALLRSYSIDASAISGIAEPGAARASVLDLADVLDQTPTAEATDPLERLVATAVARESPHRERRRAIARRIGVAIMACAHAKARASRARAARALFATVGLHAGAGASVRAALARDDRPTELARAEIDAYARDVRVIDAIAATIDELELAAVALHDSDPCSAETFVHELRRGLGVRGAPNGARTAAVRALSIDRLGGETLDLLIVVDANAGILPARDSRAGFVTQALEDALQRRDVCRFAGPASDLVELAMAVEHAGRIIICHRLADDDGAALAPSPIVSWLARGGVPVTTVHSAPLMGPPTTQHERTLALVAVAPERAALLAPHAARVAAREVSREAFHAASSGGEGAAIRDIAELGGLLEIETGGGARALSVTAVERMARCRFQGFAAQVLGALDDDPRADDVPDRREEGILAHEALGAAFTAAAPLWRERPRDRRAIEAAARQAADVVLARGGSAVVRVALDRIRLEVKHLVSLAVDDETWDFASAEQGFGDPTSEWQAFVIEGGGTRVALRGRIDRVDEAHDASAVCAIDYKRRVSLPPIADLGSTAIQVPLYALVAQRALDAPEARGRYLSTLSPVRSSTPAFDARFAAALARDRDGSSEVSRFVLELVRLLRSGDIAPRPAVPKWCAQCGLDGACRRPRFAVTLASEDDA